MLKTIKHILNRFVSLFHINDDNDEEMSLDDKIDVLVTGDMVSLKFRDPRTVGFLDPESHITSRFEPEDFQTRRLKGQVTRVVNDKGFILFELQVVKTNGTIRKYVFFEDELEELDFLDF